MRTIVCTLSQNTGSSAVGSTESVSTSLVRLGTLNTQIDDQLTKMQPGDLTIEVIDPDDAIWTFVSTQLAITGGLLPPWLSLSIGGNRVFLGTVDPSRIVRHLAADKHSIELSAQDWSVQLSGIYLGAPSASIWMRGTAYTVGNQVLANGNVYQCVHEGTSASSGTGPTGQTTVSDGSTLLWSWVQPTWVRPLPRDRDAPKTDSGPMHGYSTSCFSLFNGGSFYNIVFPGPPNLVGKGDTLTSTLNPGIKFIVTDVQSPPAPGIVYTNTSSSYPWPAGTRTQVTVGSITPGVNPWSIAWDAWRLANPQDPNEPGWTPITGNLVLEDTFFREATSYTDLNFYTVKKAIGTDPDVYTIQLDTVDGLFHQDQLHCIFGAQTDTWTVLSINPELNQVTVKEEVKNLDLLNKIYYTDETNAELVVMDARSVIQNAASPYPVDTSRFTKATLPMPVFGWLAQQGLTMASSMLPVSDVEPTISQVRMLSGLYDAFHGGPDTGWTAESKTVKPTLQPLFADWTGQRLTAPPSLMVSTAIYESLYQRRRNRAYDSFTYYSVDNGPTPGAGEVSTWVNHWTSAIGVTIPSAIIFDYLPATPRMIVVAPGGRGVTSYPWSGSAFGSGSPVSWPTLSYLTSISNFPGGPANALLGITYTGDLELALPSGSPAAVTLDDYLRLGVLVPTPYGTYIVSAQGYAQVVYSGGALSVVGVSLSGVVSCLWPNTFVARSSSEAIVLGRLDLDAGGASGATETWLFRLAIPPITAPTNASIILSEKIAEGSPVFVGAILDPTKPGRVIGHYGGRPWQFDTQMPWTVERFTPGGMTAQECIEHVCQLNNAMAVPRASGVLSIVSRSITEATIPLGVNQVANDQTLSWPNFYSIVRCTTQDGQSYYDAYGKQNGGNLLEVSSQPMLWTLSQAGAMAESYAAWFGKPRATESQTWTHPNADTAPPWEGLPPFAKITLNGTGPWRVMSTSQDFVEGTCKAVLVED